MRIYDGRDTFYQWDLNQKITSNEFTVGEEIHFTNPKQQSALVVLAYEFDDKVVADVPNILLQNSYPITAYRYVFNGNSSYTLDEHTFGVEQRPKPDSYVYSETEIYTLKTVIEEIKEIETQVETAAAEVEANTTIVRNAAQLARKAMQDAEIAAQNSLNSKNAAEQFASNAAASATAAETAAKEVAESLGDVGNIEAALDAILVIQGELIGGDVE